jgi:hypothetical protein
MLKDLCRVMDLFRVLILAIYHPRTLISCHARPYSCQFPALMPIHSSEGRSSMVFAIPAKLTLTPARASCGATMSIASQKTLRPSTVVKVPTNTISFTSESLPPGPVSNVAEGMESITWVLGSERSHDCARRTSARKSDELMTFSYNKYVRVDFAHLHTAISAVVFTI